MADRDDARPEFNPKHRIVGAIALVALVVIFVPLILDEDEPPPELKGIREIPPRHQAAETRVVVTPVPTEETRSKEGSEAAPKDATPAPLVESKPQPETKPVVPVDKPGSVKKPEAATATDQTEHGWAVQVGTFSHTQNAMRLRDRLKRQGHVVHTESVTLGGKKALRLRVGPFDDKTKAERAQAQIRKETGVAGVVQAYP